MFFLKKSLLTTQEEDEQKYEDEIDKIKNNKYMSR